MKFLAICATALLSTVAANDAEQPQEVAPPTADQVAPLTTDQEACSATTLENWTYERKECWKEISGDGNKCAPIRWNEQQSPIDIVKDKVNKDKEKEVVLKYKSSKKDPTKVKITKKQVLKFEPVSEGDDYKSTAEITWEKKKSTYLLEHIAFHWDSEHLIDGVRADLELQAFHKKEDGEGLEHAAISLMFKAKEGASENKFIKAVTDELDEQKMPSGNFEKEVEGDKVTAMSIRNLFESLDNSLSLVTYKGSKTVPLCDTTVRWFVNDKVFEIPPAQVQKFIAYRSKNFRSIETAPGQKWNSRTVYKIGLKLDVQLNNAFRSSPFIGTAAGVLMAVLASIIM